MINALGEPLFCNLRINLNIDGAPISSRSDSHPAHTQNSHVLTSSVSLGVPVPRATQSRYVRRVDPSVLTSMCLDEMVSLEDHMEEVVVLDVLESCPCVCIYIRLC